MSNSPIHLVVVLKRINTFLKNKWVRLFFLALTIFFTGLYFYNQSQSLMALIREIDIKYYLILISYILAFIAVILGGYVWVSLLKGFGYPVNWLMGLRIHLISALAKYIPGGVWQFTSKVYLSYEKDIPPNILGLVMFCEVGLTIFSGLGMGLLLSQNFMKAGWFPSWSGSILSIIGILILLFVFCSPLIIRKLIAKIIKSGHRQLNLCVLYRGVFAVFAGWIFLSTSYWFSAIAFEIKNLDILTAILVITGSYVTGFLVFFMPSGLIVREGVAAFLLIGILDANLVIVLSTILRIEIIIGEIMGLLLIFTFSHKLHKKGKLIK